MPSLQHNDDLPQFVSQSFDLLLESEADSTDCRGNVERHFFTMPQVGNHANSKTLSKAFVRVPSTEQGRQEAGRIALLKGLWFCFCFCFSIFFVFSLYGSFALDVIATIINWWKKTRRPIDRRFQSRD